MLPSIFRTMQPETWCEMGGTSSLRIENFLETSPRAINLKNTRQGNRFVAYTTKNILGIAHPKHSILLMVGRLLKGNLGYFSLLVASNQIYFL